VNTSEQINEVATALAKAQGELKNPVKSAENAHFRNRYADLATGLDAIRPILSKHGIVLTQMTFMDGDMVMLDTRIVHGASGQWFRSTYPVGRFPMKHQEVGSAITYARRYAGFAIVGIAGADDDDDGNEAQKVDMRAAPKPAPTPRFSDNDSATLLAEMQDTLALCGSVESVEAWGRANKSNKAKLAKQHQEAISAMYRERLADVSEPSQIAAE
jgi:hypothetical protein